MSPAIASFVFAALVLAGALPATAQPKTEAATKAAPENAAKTAAKAATPAKRFASPEEATEAFVAAVRKNDRKAMLAILGTGGGGLISSGDPVQDRRIREAFVQAYDRGHKLVPNGPTTVLQVGADDWPFPIPLVKEGERWRFDTQKGRQEIVARLVGRNEIYAMQTSLAYVDAQREYYQQDRDGDNILEYARQFASTPGKKDGLYWPTGAGETPSPLGALVSRARAEGYRKKGEGPVPFHGYYYRILTAQGPDAPGGTQEYVLKGHMIGGFALVAFPAQYGVSGVMTFIVNHDGVVYQKDLGPSTRSLATGLRAFNPDSTWTKADVPELTASAPSGASR
jgi:hypothetical protein